MMLFSMSTKEEGRDEDAVSSRGGLKESVWAQKPGRMGKGN